MTVLLRIPACYPLRVLAQPPRSDDGHAGAGPIADQFSAALAPVWRLEAATSPRHSRPRATLDLPFQVDILAGQLAPSSLAMYARDVRAYLRFAGSADAALAPDTLARFRAQLAEAGKHSPNTINRMLSAVKRLVQEAAAQAYVEHETAAAFGRVSGVRVRALRERLRPHSRVRIEPLDMRRVCELPDRSTLIGLRDAALLATLASSALRVAELAGLRAEDVVSRRGGWLWCLVRGTRRCVRLRWRARRRS
jgi:site-specific recombinase XerD